MSLSLSPAAWEAVGFLGQGLFTARFVVQWLASEKKKESVVPVSFWWLSLIGSAVLAAYAALGRQEPVFLFVSLINGFLYARNLLLAYLRPKRPASKKILVPAVLAIAAFLLYAGTMKLDTDVPAAWLALGFVGTTCWSGRFVIQWYASERAGRSVMPRSFWYVGLAGAVLLLSYSVHRRMPVFILGYLFPLFPYVRNLVLIFRKEGAPAPIRRMEEIWRDPRRRADALALLFVVLSAFLTVRTLKSEEPGGEFLRLDHAARLVVAGRMPEIYAEQPSGEVYGEPAPAPRPFVRPPALAVLMAPLALLPVKIAEAVWVILSACAFLLSLHVVHRLTRRAGVRAAWMWVPFLFGLRFAWDAMNQGHPEPIVFLLLVAALERAERGRTAAAALLFSLLAVFSTGLALLWMVAASGIILWRPKIALVWVVAAASLSLLLPAIVLGPGGGFSLVADYLTPILPLPDLDPRTDLSLTSAAERIFADLTFESRGERFDVSLGLVSRESVRTAMTWLGLAIVVPVFWLLSRRSRRVTPRAAIGVVVALWLAFGRGHGPEAYLALMIPAAALAHAAVSRGLSTSRGRAGAILTLAALALAAVLARAIVGKYASLLALALGSLPLAALLLFVGLVATGALSPDRERSPRSAPGAGTGSAPGEAAPSR